MIDEEPQKPLPGYRLGENLDVWSVGDLESLVDDLQSEVARVEAEIRRKKGDYSAAESLFKSKD